MRFVKLGLNPEEYIIDSKKLAAIQKLNNELFALESIAVINTPRSEADKRSKKRLEGIRDTLINKKTFTKQNIVEAFKEHTIVKLPSIETVLVFLKHYAKITYNKKTKTYRVKR